MFGLMQDRPLLIQQLIEHAALNHGDTEIVSRRVEGDIHRYTYRDARTRAQESGGGRWSPSASSRATGSAPWPGTATAISSSTTRISGMGAVCHTIKPAPLSRADRLHRQPRRGSGPLRRPQPPAARSRSSLPQFKTVKPRRGDDRPRPPAEGPRRSPTCCVYEELIAGQARHLRMAGVRRAHRLVALLHLGHDRQPQGRALLAIARPSCTPMPRRCPTRSALLGARGDPAGGADVPRQRLGPALRGRTGRRQAGVPGRGARRRKPATSCSRTEGVTLTAGVPTVWLALLDAHASRTS